jgi:DNA-binding FadR family transcriptional regulator
MLQSAVDSDRPLKPDSGFHRRAAKQTLNEYMTQFMLKFFRVLKYQPHSGQSRSNRP